MRLIEPARVARATHHRQPPAASRQPPGRYGRWQLLHPLLLHWVLNPALAFNELVLGQRIPKLTLIDKTSTAALIERRCVPCPHCQALHDGRLWSGRRGFGNWFGLLCPSCAGVIPCLWNGCSLLLLTLTFVLWGWWRKPLYRRWLAWQQRRAAQPA